MHNVLIEIFYLAHSTLNPAEVRRWLDHLKAHHYQAPQTTPAAALTSMAAKRCYNAFEPGLNPNVTRVRDDVGDHLENILKQGHGSVLEHATFTFALEGVSRVFSSEMNRHRAGWAISEASMRYIRYEDIPWWLPLSIRESANDDPETTRKKSLTRNLFRKAILHTEEVYRELVKLWELDNPATTFREKKAITSAIRRILPLGIATGGIWTGNIRAIRHVITMRAAPEAEEEIRHVFGRIAAFLVENERELFGDFTHDGQGSWQPKYRKV